MIDMKGYGLNEKVEADYKMLTKHSAEPARVIAEFKQIYKLITSNGIINAEVSGKFRFNANGTGDFPSVGDWVVIDPRSAEGNAIIQAVLPRNSKFYRAAKSWVVLQ